MNDQEGINDYDDEDETGQQFEFPVDQRFIESELLEKWDIK